MKPGRLFLVIVTAVTFAVNSPASTYYVAANNTAPLLPYTSWATAATNIQDALQAAGSVGATILVTNGIYQYGGGSNMGSNRVNVIYPGFTVQSVNGPAVTVIKGYQLPGVTNGAGAVRGVFLAGGSTLSGFTVTGGAVVSVNAYAGGIYCQSSSSVVTNCIVTANAGALWGGGVYSGTFNNCVIFQNTAPYGGGAYQGQFNNCLIVSNTASTSGGGGYGGIYNNCTIVANAANNSGGGVYGGTGAWLYNSIAYYNSAPSGPNLAGAKFNYSCSTSPLFGDGDITNFPGFVDMAGGNFRLQTGSPCVDAGTNADAPGGTDLDGNPRIVDGTVDMGAYENQNTNLIHYVSLNSTNPVSPYTNWLTAATNLQDAISIAQPGDIVAANAGVYTNGGVVMFGAETNRVAVTNGITLLAVYGWQATLIAGGTQTRCVYVGSNSVVSGFTITNGHVRTSGGPNLTNEESGGGIWCEPGGAAMNCLVVSNFANFGPGNYNGGYGGGVYGGTISNCNITGNIAGLGGGAGGGGILWNCTLANNAAGGGGGAYRVALYNCTLSNNAAPYNGFNGAGGGASQCFASNCLLTGNSDSNLGHGGGAFQGTNINCTITDNWANYGGGTYQSTNYNCFISGNTAPIDGGGAYQGALYNCLLTGNLASNSISFYGNGAGTYGATLVNCTVTGNMATGTGGGVYGGLEFNSIVYFNTAAGGGANWTNSPQMFYCCTTPLVFNEGNFTNDPSFVDAAGGDYQLKCGSPCIDAGFTNSFIQATTNDIRGAPRPVDGNGDGIAQIDMGAYEYNPATDEVPGIRAVSSYSTFATSFVVSFVAQIGGCADYFWWDFGDGTTVTNQINVSHAWSAPGTFTVRLSASYSGSVLSAMTTVQVVQQPVYYVNAANATPVAPYTNWTKAATSIQPAVAAGNTPGRLVLVTNGNYGSYAGTVNGVLLNCVALTNAVFVQSVNGAQVTVIRPAPTAAGRCGYISSNAVLSGFALTGGSAGPSGDTNKDQSGGGLWCEPGGVVSNCVISGNQASFNGGGAFQGTFYNCVFSNNAIYTTGSTAGGGGAYLATLYNCNLISNKVSSSFPGGKGGGSFGGTLYNCTLTGNSVNNGDLTGTGGGAFLGTLYNCVLTGNSGNGYGGGACSNTLWNCTLSGNWANYGGGAFASTLYNCLITGNTAASQGGGSYLGTFYNCTLAGNTAPTGAGIYWTFLAINSIIYDNTNSSGAVDNWDGNTLGGTHNCIYPQFLPAASGNITNDPAFVNLPDGDFHLQPNSPCINTGTNALVYGATDLDGNPRIMGGTVDMGAFEFQAQVTGTFAAWLQQYGLPTDGTADYADSDGTGMANWQKWLAGLNPTNPASVLVMVAPAATNNAAGITVSWQSVGNRNYFVQRGSDLSAQPIFATLAAGIPGQDGTTSYTDTTATNGGSYFYRVGVQ